MFVSVPSEQIVDALVFFASCAERRHCIQFIHGQWCVLTGGTAKSRNGTFTIRGVRSAAPGVATDKGTVPRDRDKVETPRTVWGPRHVLVARLGVTSASPICEESARRAYSQKGATFVVDMHRATNSNGQSG